VVLEGLVSAYFLGHRVKEELLPGVGIAASVVLWIYVVLRLGELALRGNLGMAFDGSAQSFLFLFEMGMAAILPASLLLFRKVRTSVTGMGICAVLTVLGPFLIVAVSVLPAVFSTRAEIQEVEIALLGADSELFKLLQEPPAGSRR